jgi:inosose dehydratase
MTPLLHRVAGAPITWGVDGSPGWGYLMDRNRVMAEMAGVGLNATELGPDGYLPADPGELGAFLDRFGLRMVAGFVPAVLYRDDLVDEQLEYAERAARQLAAAGGTILVLGPASHLVGYDTSIDLSDDEWRVFFTNLERLTRLAAKLGLTTALHPHWGMVVERSHQLDRVLTSSDVPLCLDTGHLFLGGVDPAAVAADAADRIVHVHLKDVDQTLADRVRAGAVGFRRAVIEGMFCPLGRGAVDVEGVIDALESASYEGWYVLEQDVSLDAEPAPGEGPVTAAGESVGYLRDVAARLGRR